MGHYHGREGFETFSKLRPVFRQGPVSSVQMIMQPPYWRVARRMVGLHDVAAELGGRRAGGPGGRANVNEENGRLERSSRKRRR